MSSESQSRVRALSSWVVLALVASATRSPVSQWRKRSGISSSVSAASSAALPRAATSWSSVLMGMNWIPVRA